MGGQVGCMRGWTNSNQTETVALQTRGWRDGYVGEIIG